MAFSGWDRQDFVDGESLYPGLDSFQKWIRPDDVLCWWHQEANDLFNMFTKIAQVRDLVGKVIFLGDYIYGFLAGQKALCSERYTGTRACTLFSKRHSCNPGAREGHRISAALLAPATEKVGERLYRVKRNHRLSFALRPG